jgi:hypothetical protein
VETVTRRVLLGKKAGARPEHRVDRRHRPNAAAMPMLRRQLHTEYTSHFMTQ